MPTTNVSETIDFNGQQFFIGLDVHKKSWSAVGKCGDCFSRRNIHLI